MAFITSITVFIRIISTKSQENWVNPCSNSINTGKPFCDASLSFKQRAYDLVYKQEASIADPLNAYQFVLGTTAIQINEVGIPPYQWWSEALHGVALSSGVNYNGAIKATTMFPQVIGTSSSFDNQLFFDIGNVISTEARAMWNNNQAGLTFWSPNVNIFRDPRWGRGQETPGDDPFLNAQYAVNFVRGMQGYYEDTDYLKTSACCKHAIDYSMENSDGYTRDNFNAIVNEYDQHDTYLVAFKYCIQDGNVSSIMCSYNEENGIPSCTNGEIVNNLFRQKWGFEGYITSDCGAVWDLVNTHKTASSYEIAVGQTLNATMDINCGQVLQEHTKNAVNQGVLNKSTVQLAVYHTSLTQIRLGMFDDNSKNPWNKLGANDVCSNKSLELALNATRKSMVLLKNKNNTLPIDASKIKNCGIAGPNANNPDVQKGNYYGVAPFIITVQAGIQEYIASCTGSGGTNNDLLILVQGLSQQNEAEFLDRTTLILPGDQDKNIATEANQCKTTNPSCKVILVIMSGGCVDISQWEQSDLVDAIIWAGYPGMYGGKAIADVIFGTFAPYGRLSQTWYFENYTDEQYMVNMGMRPAASDGYGHKNPGRGYRYYPGPVIYPFGYGLEYTTFTCSTMKLVNGVFSTSVTNTGNVNSGGIVLVYFIPLSPGGQNPLKRLIGYGNIDMIKVKETESIEMEIYQEFDTSSQGKYVLDGVCK